MEPPAELRWEIFFYDLLWIAPIVIGAICVVVALHAKRVRPAVTTIMLCFVMAVALIGLGVFGTWRGGLAIYEIIGVAGDISAELMYEGWKRSWLPLLSAGGFTVLLLAIAEKARRDWLVQGVGGAV